MRRVYVDPEIGNEGFTYVLESGAEGTIHVDDVLAHNRDPGGMQQMLLYELTLEARRALSDASLTKRAVARRLRTSMSQLSRLLDPANSSKSIERMIALLHVLGRDVSFRVRRRRRGAA